MKPLAILLLLTLQPASVDCEAVRARVKELGKVRAYAMALAHGLTPSEISRIRKMCGI